MRRALFWSVLPLLVAPLAIPTSSVDAQTPDVGPGDAVVQVVAGFQHTCEVLESGRVLCWGENSEGQLGTGDRVKRLSPTDVPGLVQVVQVAAGFRHTCALGDDGTVVCWGDGSRGQLGNGSTADQLAPVVVPGLSDVAQITTGREHTCARTVDGALLCWGDNQYGQVGNDTTESLWATPQPVTGMGGVVKEVAAGWDHTCATLDTATAFCWGRNEQGQLGNTQHGAGELARNPQSVANGFDVVDVEAGGAHSCAVQIEGAIICWGAGALGQQGNGGQTLRASAGSVDGFSSGGAAMTLGESHTCALTTESAMLCWGDNANGQLASGPETMRLTPAAVIGLPGAMQGITAGALHTCGLSPAGVVFCWGANGSGQLGQGDSNHRAYPAIVKQPPTCYRLATGHTGEGFDPVVTWHSGVGCAAGAYLEGEELRLLASPANRWVVAAWSGTEDDSSSAMENSALMPAADYTITVTYEPTPPVVWLPAVRR